MATEDFKRKLTAVFSADVAGYSRLMAEDEAETVKTLNTYKEIMSTLIKQHRGRVVDSPGDNLLAEFASVVDAVQCAVSVQKEFQARNANLPENRRMEFRIGINLGDVIEEEDRIFGDGVNIAARLESLAEPGGICVSKTSFDHIESKLPLGYEYLGEQTVKNIPKPVGAYRVVMEPRVTAAGVLPGRRSIVAGVITAVLVVIALGVWRFYLSPPKPTVEPASVEKMAFPLPDRPSIVVLPFKNMTGDPDQEYFSDGFTKAIITRLLKIPDVFVISGPSSRLYKGKKVKVHQVAEDLGVRYVLEGSVQKAGDRIRVTALLIDAITGEHRWAELYDRELKDIFAVQDEVIRKVVTELAVQMTQGEWARSMMHSSYNYEAVDYYLRADKELTKFEKEANILGRELLMKALELDPNYARAIAYLGWTNLYEVMNGWTKNPAESLQKAEELAKRAVFINENDYLGHALLSRIYTLKRQYELAIAAGKRSVEVEPNNSNAMVILGHTMMFAGKPAEALALSRKAMRLSPYPPSYFHHLAGAGNYFTGQYEAAISQYQKYLQRQQQGGLARFSRQSLIASYMELGREEEARVEVDKFLKQDPKICIEGLIKQTKRLPFKKYAFLDRQIELLRKAGLPQTPPLPLPDKPSIAVLPFVNMSGDPEQEYLSDGITEQIITGLSKVPKLFVIARTSSFKYKGKEIDVRKVGREVGVRYVLEGSVQKSENRLRITAQLIDAIEGHHLWSESYDRELKDIFALQDDITMKIITALEVKLTEGEKARLASKGTENLQAYLKYLQASGPFYTFTKEGNAQARRLLEEAIALDPEFPAAYLLLGNTQFMDVPFGASKNPRESIKRAFESINKAIALDEDFAGAHAVLGGMYILKERNYDKAIAECERALDLAPNLDVANIWMGIVLTWAGRHEEAVQYAEQALRLNPMPEPWSFRALGSAYFWVGRYEEAIAAYKKALQRAPDDILTHLYLTAAYSRAGRLEEARAEAEEVLRINPKFCVSRRPGVFKNPADDELIKNARRKAGLPDCPPRRGSK